MHRATISVLTFSLLATASPSAVAAHARVRALDGSALLQIRSTEPASAAAGILNPRGQENPKTEPEAAAGPGTAPDSAAVGTGQSAAPPQTPQSAAASVDVAQPVAPASGGQPAVAPAQRPTQPATQPATPLAAPPVVEVANANPDARANRPPPINDGEPAANKRWYPWVALAVIAGAGAAVLEQVRGLAGHGLAGHFASHRHHLLPGSAEDKCLLIGDR